MERHVDLHEPFAQKITRNIAVLPRGWPTAEERNEKPDHAVLSAALDSAIADAQKRWEKGPKAALEPLLTLHEQLTLYPSFSNMTSLMQYATAFYKATGPDLTDTGFERWNRAVDAGLLDFCEQVISNDDVLSQIYQVNC